MSKLRVTVWNEFRHEKTDPACKAVYPDGLHATIKAFLDVNEDMKVRLAALDDPDQGLPDEVLELLKDGKITNGHARAILGLEYEDQMILLANKVVERDLSVREVESMVRRMLAEKDVAELNETRDEVLQRRVYMRELERRAMDRLGRRVKINQTAKKKTVELTFDSDSDLEEVLCLLCGDNFFKS